MRIDIIAATYPTGYDFVVTDRTSSNNEPARRFYCSQAIADDIFTTTFSKHLNQLAPVYEMYAVDRKYEFKLIPQWPSQSNTGQVPMVYLNYSVAKLNGTSTEYYIEPTSYTYLNNTDPQNITDSPSARLNIGLDEYLKYTRDSVGNGLTLVVDSLPANGGMALYQVTARIKMGTV
jgi:hypothetical protein